MFAHCDDALTILVLVVKSRETDAVTIGTGAPTIIPQQSDSAVSRLSSLEEGQGEGACRG